MSTDPTEYGVPVIFDVTAHSREDAGEAVVAILAGHQLPGNKTDIPGRGTAMLESWWTLEGVDKEQDGNDNDPGVVVFATDLDYLRALLIRTRGDGSVMEGDINQHQRLIDYFDPDNRIGWSAPGEDVEFVPYNDTGRAEVAQGEMETDVDFGTEPSG